jgi:hypothetical protein
MTTVFYAVKNAQGEYALAYLLRPGSKPPSDSLLLAPARPSWVLQEMEVHGDAMAKSIIMRRESMTPRTVETAIKWLHARQVVE